MGDRPLFATKDQKEVASYEESDFMHYLSKIVIS